MVRLAPDHVSVSVYSKIGALPLFNPDLEPHLPDPVSDWRRAVGQADALLIASPEYAHGISGPMKNALDWLVSHEDTVAKPVAVVNTSSRARHADEAIREVLQTMSIAIIRDASISLPLAPACVTEQDMLRSPEVRQAVEQILLGIARESHFGKGD